MIGEYDSDEDTRDRSHFGLRSIAARDWPYVLMLVLAIFGVAYTNFARQAMTGYWVILAPVFGLACVAAGWRDLESSRSQLRLIVTQALHWTAVVSAMYLVFVADVKQMMSEPGASASSESCWDLACPPSLGSRRERCLSCC